jgi:hypothetical protein
MNGDDRVLSIVLAAEHFDLAGLDLLVEDLEPARTPSTFAGAGLVSTPRSSLFFFSDTMRSRSCSSAGGAAGSSALRPGPSRNRVRWRGFRGGQFFVRAGGFKDSSANPQHAY